VAERGNYPASVAKIAELLRTLIDLEVTQAIPAQPESFSRFQLASDGPGRGTTLVFRNAAGAELANIVLGKRLGDDAASDPLGMGTTAGRFVRITTDPAAVYVVGKAFGQLTSNPHEWLDDTFIQVEKIRSVNAARPADPAFQAWSLTRSDENSDFSLTDAPPATALNPSATTPIKSALLSPSFVDVVPAAEAAAVLDSPQAWDFVVETFEGLTYTLRLAPLTAEGAGDNAEAEYLMRVAVTGTLPGERAKAPNEPAEATEQLDAAFAERLAILNAKLEMNKRLAGRAFRVTRWNVEALIKTRQDLIAPAPAPSAPANP
jgi:hypothetical protein